MGYRNRIGFNKLGIIIAACLFVLVMVSANVYAETNRFYGYTVPETYREDGSKFGSFRYEGYPIYIQALGENGEATDNSQVVYCFNLTKAAPTSKHVSAAERVFYTRKAGTADSFCKYADNKKLGESAEKDILNVLFKGFPQNGTGIMEKYSLDEEEFRYVTQCAVWFYTDDGIVELQTGSDDMKAAYREMIKSESKNLAKETLGTEMTLEIFVSENTRYQHLIGTSFKTADEISAGIHEDEPGEEVAPEDEPGEEIMPEDEPGEEVTPEDEPGEKTVEIDVDALKPASESRKYPDTGDVSPLLPYTVLLLSTSLALIVVVIKRRKSR